MKHSLTEQQFLHDVATHEMQIIVNDGVRRHIRFKRPGTMCMHFDLITWPGHLCYTGDMGTYVFTRLLDMFEFFRRPDERAPFRIDMRYWAEKCIAQDRDGITEFSREKFHDAVDEHLNSYMEAYFPDSPSAERKELCEGVHDDVKRMADDGEHAAIGAALSFRYRDKLVFRDFDEVNVREYVHRFQWCCHALEWGIAKYDAETEGTHIGSDHATD